MQIKKGFLKVDEAFELFSSHQVGFTRKETFIRLITDKDRGLNVHVVQFAFSSIPVRYIVMKTPGLSVGELVRAISMNVKEILGR